MSISTEDLEAAGLDHLSEEISGAITEEDEGDKLRSNLAVVTEPYAGREALLDYVEETAEGEVYRERFEGITRDLPEFDGYDVVVLDNCQYLYTREVGGFEVLDRLLDRAAVSDALFVTGWNRYAWEYLTAVRDVDEVFPQVVEMPALDASGVADLLLANYSETMPEFVQTGEAGRVKTVDVERTEVSPLGRSVSVPVPTLNVEYLTSLGLSRSEEVEDTQAVVFQKIARLSNGNPGVATTIWERSRQDWAIAPSYVEAADPDLAIDDEEAFVLEVLLAKGRLSVSSLAMVLDQLPVERLVQSLVHQGIVRVDDGTVSIDPESLHATVNYLQGRRFVW